MSPTTEKFTSGLAPAPPPRLGLSWSPSLKYCRYLAFIRRKINYRYAAHHIKICSSTKAGAQRVLQLKVLVIYCLHLAPAPPPGLGSAGPPAQNIAGILPAPGEIFTIIMPPTTEKFSSGMAPAPPPRLGLSGSSSSKYCRYLAYIRRKMDYCYDTDHRKIYKRYGACSSTKAGA
jgi:hypothetical protein